MGPIGKRMNVRNRSVLEGKIMNPKTLEHLDTARNRIRCWRFGPMPKYGIVPVRKVRWLLDVTEQRVSELIRDGKLSRVDFCGVVCVTDDSVISYDQSGRDWGGQRVKKHGGTFKKRVVA